MTVDELVAQARSETGACDLTARSVFWVQHGTRLAGSPQLFRNRYVLVRVESAFGACAVEEGELDGSVADLSGSTVADLLAHPALPVRVAALDAHLGARSPHRDDPRAERVLLPTGTPDQRAVARDAAVASLLDITPGSRVALIGVVNPLVAAIRERGGECLPCDLALTRTHWGDPVTSDMAAVLERADAVLATGMTIGNGSFDTIRETCARRGVPLTVYAQSAASVARALLGRGVTALSAEPMSFSQLSADESPLYLYRHHRGAA
ncbi:Rossmann-like domain-containing protein [Luteipulveratus halotolerans]|uniref:Putative heavy-metal chelation domain-containing protein n=1 Tax=Luteipulveratus halotolerans TaxID=1631356 RepID=A0A0L6CMN7_9MICO|nr:DUF364 domain-containing protein [Luteipulveratus halotolerans]KNX38925.1 hypothetical protein VV01_20195 [Luteipulveratus halotolerans]